MNGLLLHLRAEARRRWSAWVAVILLVGLVGGLVLSSLAGARRTSAAFPELLEETNAAHVLVNPDWGAESALDVDDVAALPQVESLGVLDGIGAGLLDENGELLLTDPVITFGQRDPHVVVDLARPGIIEGELFDPARADQVMVTEDVAERRGLEVGDKVDVGAMDLAELIAWEEAGAEGPLPVTPHEVTLTAVVVMPDDIVVDESVAAGTVLLTEAFVRAHDVPVFFYGIAVRLHGGDAAVPEFRAAVRALVPDEAFEFQTLAAVRDTVDRGTRPHVVALLLFAAVVGLAGLVVSGQAIGRQLVPLLEDAPSLRAVGADRRRLRLAAAIRALFLAGAGAVLAFVIAMLASPLFPLGIARQAELDGGIDFDLFVLVPGVSALVVLLVGWAMFTTRRFDAVADVRTARRSALVERMSQLSAGPVATMGLRAAITPSRSRRGMVPARAAVAGLALAVAAVAATITFGASLEHLVTTPAAYGWTWDAGISLPVEGDMTADVTARVEAAHGFAAWSLMTADQLPIGQERVPAVGVDYREGELGPTILDGRAPGPGEIALGGRTMDLLDVGIGDRLIIGERGREEAVEVVGQAIFPGLGTYKGADRSELGKGALLDRTTLSETGEGFTFDMLVVDALDHASLQRGLDDVLDDYQAALELGDIEVFDEPQRPTDVQGLEMVRSTPVVIAGILGLLAGAALAFVLVAGVQARRREIALLKTFGFERRQVGGTVAWQATVTAGIAVLVGIPAGVVVGRAAWSVLAEALGVGDELLFSPSLLLLAVAVLALANLLAVVPGRLAARTRPALALRAE